MAKPKLGHASTKLECQLLARSLFVSPAGYPTGFQVYSQGTPADYPAGTQVYSQENLLIVREIYWVIYFLNDLVFNV